MFSFKTLQVCAENPGLEDRIAHANDAAPSFFGRGSLAQVESAFQDMSQTFAKASEFE